MLFFRYFPSQKASARLLLASLAASALGSTPTLSEVVTLQGSTTFSARLIEPYRKEIETRAALKLDVVANKSIHGLVALLEGRTRMAMISSSLEGERKLLRRKRPDLPVDRLQAFQVSSTRIAFVVHPSNPVRTAKLQDVARVLLGEFSNWQQLGGADRPIAVVTVQPGGGVPTTVRSRLLDGRAMAPGRMIEMEAPSHVLKVTSQLEGALGIAQLGLLETAKVRELMTERPIEQMLNLVTLGAPDAQMQAVITAARQVAKEKLQ